MTSVLLAGMLLSSIASIAAGDSAACDTCSRADEITDQYSPAQLEKLLVEPAGSQPDLLLELAAGLNDAPEVQSQRIIAYMVETVAARLSRLQGRGPPLDRGQAWLLWQLLSLDPATYSTDPYFRRKVLPILQQGISSTTPDWLQQPVLDLLYESPGFEFDLAEDVEFAWGNLERRSGEREIASAKLSQLTPGDVTHPIGISVYSLPSEFFDENETARFLTAVHQRSPRRRLLIISDRRPPLDKLSAAAVAQIQYLPNHGRPYSPWPRDPMSFLQAPQQGLIALLRPNEQTLREEDALMGRLLIQRLPTELDNKLGGTSWSLSPIPFHNGHILMTPGTTWISIHSLEIPILEILELERVPVASFASPDGVRAYLGAAWQAADDLESLYGQPVRFIHPLPARDDPNVTTNDLVRLAGGAGFDLDSIVTLLPLAEGRLGALVADPTLGERLIDDLPLEQLADFRLAYDLRPPAPELRPAIAAIQQQPRAVDLAEYLDLVAEFLSSQEIAVHRLPLLLIPTGLLHGAAEYRDPYFLVGWNNVVFEIVDEKRQAEGFATLLPAGDELAEALFRSLGYDLELLPPLLESVRRNGGYRCASNHIRFDQH